MVETEEFLQPALTHTHSLPVPLSHSYSYYRASVCSSCSYSRTLNADVDVDYAVATLLCTAEHSHTHRHIQSHTRIFVIFIFSFRLLAWRFLIAMISFHLCFNFISFQTRARTLSLHLACADCSLNAIGLAYTAPATTQRHTQIEQVACNQ